MKLSRNGDFMGREASQRIASEPLAKRLACFTVADPAIVLLGRETILRDGEPVGYLTSGGHGYSLNMGIGYGYVRHDGGVDDGFPSSGSYELVVATERVPAQFHTGPLYDPQNHRVKA